MNQFLTREQEQELVGAKLALNKALLRLQSFSELTSYNSDCQEQIDVIIGDTRISAVMIDQYIKQAKIIKQ